ncbi:MAG TPA: hypothetical protein VNO31_00655 [Umezawaea sp.]|nr:hypothetical protein [Umezawaea sp.]
MRTTSAGLLALATAVTSVVAFAAPASAADQVTVQADLNGDGRLDRVVAETIAGNPNEQFLVATIRGIRLTAHAPLNSYTGVQPLRVVDLNDDGSDEVVVTESVGANTVKFSVWGLYGGLRPVTLPDGSTLALWEGGGISALSGYGCEADGDARRLVTVRGLLDWDNGVYSGERVTYAVADGVATETSRTPVVGPRTEPGFQVDPLACA